MNTSERLMRMSSWRIWVLYGLKGRAAAKVNSKDVLNRLGCSRTSWESASRSYHLPRLLRRGRTSSVLKT